MANLSTHFFYVHSTPGRMRIQVPAYRGEERSCRWMRQVLGARPGIECVTASALTGNILILFDTSLLSDRQILEELRRMGLHGDLIASGPTLATAAFAPPMTGSTAALLARFQGVSDTLQR